MFDYTNKLDESYSFTYDDFWLKSTSVSQFFLDPNLEFYSGKQYPIHQNVFRIFSDSCPDRWGRVLMKRRERILAEKENRKPNTLSESDFLLGVYDQTRIGSLQFKTDKKGPFLSDDANESVPPWTKLRDLEEASRRFKMSDDA